MLVQTWLSRAISKNETSRELAKPRQSEKPMQPISLFPCLLIRRARMSSGFSNMIRIRLLVCCVSCACGLLSGQEVVEVMNDDFVIDGLLTDAFESDLSLIQFQPPRRGRPTAPSTTETTSSRRRRSVARTRPILARVPSMFGDFFGGGRPRSGTLTQNRRAPPRGGAAVRLVKIAENYTPVPRNRLFATYHFFNDVFDGEIGDVNRYVAGFESTYWDDMRSIEVRCPFAHTLDSRQLDDPVNAKNTEFGNINVTLKNVLLSRDDWLLSGGVGFSLPTADDNQVARPGDLREILRVQNEAVHLLPFLGLIATPSDKLFVQSFFQLDVDANGSSVRGDLMAMNLQPIGVIQDPTLMFLDLSVGYWLYDDPCAGCVTGVASIVEVHYTTTLNESDLIDQAGFLVGDLSNRFDILNLTLGTHFEFKDRYSLRPGFVIPLRDGDDRQFDFEFFVQGNVGF